MSYLDVFNEAIEMIEPINDKLAGDAFIIPSLDKLCGDGVQFSTSSNTKTIVPYEGAGIYVFWANLEPAIKSDEGFLEHLLSEFLDKWDTPVDEMKYFPKSNKKRAKLALKNAKPGYLIPFYLGKSKKVSDRVYQHLYLEPHKKTYALKLNNRTELLKDIDFEITWLPLLTNSSNYFLVSRVESLLRERLNPIIGKQ